MVDARRFPFRKSQRLLTGDQFTRVLRGGQYAADGTLVVTLKSNALDISRLGVTIPRRAGNAVIRNRWKRHIREAFRLQQHHLPTGYDIVVRPKKDAVPDGKAVHASLPRLIGLAVRRLEKSRRS